MKSVFSLGWSPKGGGGKSVQPNPLTNELIVLSRSGTDPIRPTLAL